MKIIHVTESLGGGVLNIIQSLCVSQIDCGCDVIVIHSVRGDTPKHDFLEEIFPSPIRRILFPMVTNISFVKDYKALLDLFYIIKNENPDVIHLHSSKAGVLGRLACFFLGVTNCCFYTPHGYSFLRKDISRIKYSLFKFIEYLVSLTGTTTIACSKSEFDHTQNTINNKKVRLVENSVPVFDISIAVGNVSPRCVISTSGRLSPPKNPIAFRDLAISIDIVGVDFLWIGGGELYDDLLIDGVLPNSLKCTGWVSRNNVSNFLKHTDIFVMTSLWEGMPLSLIEAQVAGLPAVVPNVEGCRDVVINGVTGYVCNSPSEMKERVTFLISNIEHRLIMGKAARDHSIKRFSPERMNAEIMAAYKA